MTADGAHSTRTPPAASNRRAVATAGACVAAAAAMLALAFASKPLYDTFCRVTGFGGETRVADAGAAAVSDRAVSVRFDANAEPGLPLAFKPLQIAESFRLGENGLAFYEVANTSDRPVRAVATYNVTPHKAGPYFAKLECFCFQEQEFAPGESQELPVLFFVDPALDADPQLEDVRAITLSYTFFEVADANHARAAATRDDEDARGG